MKKYLIALALLAPVLTFAFSDHTSISPIVPVCGPQTLSVTVTSQFGHNNRHLVTYLDGHKINHYNNEPSTVTENVSVGVGGHQFKSVIYLIEWDANHFSIPLASNSKSFTVNTCEEPVVIDVCPNLDGDQAEVPEGYTLSDNVCTEDVIEVPPTDLCPNIEGVQTEIPEGQEVSNGACQDIPAPVSHATKAPRSGGSSIQSRLCFLSNQTICYSPFNTNQEAIPLMIKLVDLIIQSKNLTK